MKAAGVRYTHPQWRCRHLSVFQVLPLFFYVLFLLCRGFRINIAACRTRRDTFILTLKRPRKKLYPLSDPLKGAPAMVINIAASVVATKHTAIVETVLRTLREGHYYEHRRVDALRKAVEDGSIVVTIVFCLVATIDQGKI
jgi:hypothetical protein